MSENTENDELLMDTSKMNEGKRAAMEVAEMGRMESENESFAGNLFMGIFDADQVLPFPNQDPEDEKFGLEYTAKVSKFLKENLDADEVDETREIPQGVIDGLKDLNVFAMKVPKEFGGMGLSQMNYAKVMTAISSHCGSTAVLVSAHQSIGVPQPLKLYGTPEQKAKYMPWFKEGKISAFALTEPGVGSDPAKMETFAKLSDDGKTYTINGTKLWCTNGLIADVMVVMTQTAPVIKNGREIQQISAFLVEKGTPGMEYVHRCDFMGLRAIQNGVIEFKDVVVPAENLLWGEGKGLKLALATLNMGRLTIPAACTGMGKQCLQIARRWGNDRVQWGASIGKHQEGSDKIARIASNTFAMEAVTTLSCNWANNPDKEIRIEAAMAKMFCSEVAWDVVDTTLQLRGGRGFEKASSLKGRGEEPYPVERMMRDCRINRIIEGTTDIMRLFLAREALNPHLKMASDLLKAHSPIGAKIKSGAQLAKFYSRWYPAQWIHSGLWENHSDKGPLGKHYHYIDQTSHKLARTILHCLGLYQDKLEDEQIILGDLMEIGSNLFAMAATCAYADKLIGEKENMTPKYLADVFCIHTEKKISQLFDRIDDYPSRKQGKLADSILEGDLKWLEEGIIEAVTEEELKNYKK